jgi:hypothetical protein
MKKYGFVYLWRDRKHKKYYVGCHWGDEDDVYISSCKWMNKAYKRRPQDFKRKILKRVYTTREDLLNEEHRWLQQIKDEELKVRYYNTINKKFNHWSAQERDDVRKTISEKTKEAMQRDDVRQNYEKGMKKRNNRASDFEVIEKRRKSMKATMAEKFPVEDRLQRKKWGSDEFIKMHQNNTKEMWLNRTQEEKDEIVKKIQKKQIENGTLQNGVNACKKANLGTKRLIKGSNYKKAKPGSDKWNTLISEGWDPKLC